MLAVGVLLQHSPYCPPPPLPFPPFPRLTHGSCSEEQGDHLGGQSSKCQPNSFHVSNACQKHQVSFFCHFQWEPNCIDGSGSSILRLVRLRELCMCSRVAASICQPVWCTEAQKHRRDPDVVHDVQSLIAYMVAAYSVTYCDNDDAPGKSLIQQAVQQ